MKQITAKYIREIEKMSDEQILKVLNEETELNPVACVNWKEYPYCPEVGFHLAYSDEVIAVMFKVKEEHLRGTAMEINGPVWEDSCVEVFFDDPFSEKYYNFETNCIGTQLASKRISRTEADHFDAVAMAKIRCFASLPHEPIDSVAPDQSWWLVELIPFSAIGLDKAPESLRGNFYKCGDKCKDMHFLSWSEIDLPAPDFHCPKFFGEILFT
ncbi:MAG: hypothetical protein IKW20_01460 [Bacteroidales bacterium]|nr:hypothetical protein [Bacteroidales bacterium]